MSHLPFGIVSHFLVRPLQKILWFFITFIIDLMKPQIQLIRLQQVLLVHRYVWC